MENKKKYESQIKYLIKTKKAFHIDFDILEFEQFVEYCRIKNTTPTTVIKDYVRTLIKNN